jgi:GNAT superfamily N-acetyltransferase
MKIEITPNLSQEQKVIITRLWNVEYPEQLKYENVEGFEAFLNGITEHKHFLLLDDNENLKAWLVSFNREGERWFSIIVDGSEQKQGFGTRLLNEVKQHENKLNGWVVPHNDYFKSNGEKYLSPIEFYKKNDFTILENVRHEKLPNFYFIKINWKK